MVTMIIQGKTTLVLSILLAVILDFIIGDPYTFPHPVKLMGKIIAVEEKLTRKWCRTPLKLKYGGLAIVLINIFTGFLVPLTLLKYFERNTVLHTIANTYLIYTCIAARNLHFEAMMVLKSLKEGLESGRKRLSYIVGRDTANLTEEQIIRATVETVAENTSDGVIGPLLYIFLFGAPGGLTYKFINTMDSMLGYMNEKYRDVGYFPAKTDDLFNLIPARITGILMILSSMGRFDSKNGWRILKRDCRNHKSPNSGYPESAVAGLLGIKLGGGNYYHGVYVHKPNIGDSLNQIKETHIKKTIEIMYRAEILFLVLYMLTVFILV